MCVIFNLCVTMEQASGVRHNSVIVGPQQPSSSTDRSGHAEANILCTHTPVLKQCDLCENLFTTEALYHVHSPCYYTRHGVEKPKTHKRMGDLRPFLCFIGDCDNSFATMDVLRCHVARHFTPSYKCISCDYRAHLKRGIQRHYDAVHRKKKNFKCHECGKAYGYKALLQEHQRRHANEKPYECECCGKAFVTYNNWKVHVLRHQNEKKFECEFCDKTFVRKYELQQHTSRRHDVS